jgi:hypothetical protein
MFRSSDGNLRIDSPETSVITSPLAQQMIVLVHATMEVHVVPLPPATMLQVAAPALSAPGLAGAAIPPIQPTQIQPTSVLDLGKSVIEGQEVTGKEFTFAPPNMPALPGVPHSPQAPAIPGQPQPPPPPHTVMEAWTSVATLLPVLTKVTGPFGTQICRCNTAPSVEPSPSMFQIPPGYRPAGSPPPQGALPQVPPAPKVPDFPK